MKRIFHYSKPKDCIVQVSTEWFSPNEVMHSLQKTKPTKVLFLVDRVIFEKIDHLIGQLRKGLGAALLCIEGGEKIKDFDHLQKILHWLSRENADRNSLLVVIGGGALTDLGGFAASTFMRGIKTVYFPTTFLSMVDAALGGKTAINLGDYKNMVGAFWNPDQVHIHLPFLDSLPEREYQSCFSEVLKYALLKGDNVWDTIVDNWEESSKRKKEALYKVINCCVSAKMEIVEEDFAEETDVRRILNLGHTLAHGIEGGSKQFNHGEAVSFGIVFSMLASHIDGGLPLKTVAKVVKLLVKAKLPVDFRPFVNETILDKIWKDKKRILDKIRFVFIDRPGIVRVEAVSRDDFQKILKEGMELLPKVYETMGELDHENN